MQLFIDVLTLFQRYNAVSEFREKEKIFWGKVSTVTFNPLKNSRARYKFLAFPPFFMLTGLFIVKKKY